MTMELINRKHELIAELPKTGLDAFFKIESEKAVYFSARVVQDHGLSTGLFMHFIDSGSQWNFYCNSDPDGFKLSLACHQVGRTALVINSKALVTLIRKRILISIGTKFPVRLTSAKLNGDHLMEIDFNKPMES